MSAHTEHDVTPKANLIIWGYLLVFAVILYLMITGLSIFFKSEVEREQYLKVGSVKSKKLMDIRHQETGELQGIEQAMEKVVRAAN